MSESLFQVSFHWCSGLTAGHRVPSLHPQRPTPPSLTSGNFYSCHMLSQMTQLTLQLPSQHSAPSLLTGIKAMPSISFFGYPGIRGLLFFPLQDWFLHLTHKQIEAQLASGSKCSLQLQNSLSSIRGCSASLDEPNTSFVVCLARLCSADLFVIFLLCSRGVTQDHQAARCSIRVWWPAQREECSCQQHPSSCQRHK